MKGIRIEVWSNMSHYSDLITDLFSRKNSGIRLWEPYNGGGIVALRPKGVIEGTFLQKTKFNNDCQDFGV